MPEETRVAHSLSEIRLYAKAAWCAACGQGPMRGSEPRPANDDSDRSRISMTLTCTACGADQAHLFELQGHVDSKTPQPVNPINPTDECSRILDVGQWIVLARMLMEESAREPKGAGARSLGMQAVLCLDEALKFYDDPDNDLPPPEALFCETSLARFRESPEQFSKQRLVSMRAKLPHAYRADPRTS